AWPLGELALPRQPVLPGDAALPAGRARRLGKRVRENKRRHLRVTADTWFWRSEMMNPGPVEEAGKAANTFMDVMRSQPLSLALVVISVMLMAYLFYNAQKSGDARKDFADKLFAKQKHQAALFAGCIFADDFLLSLEGQRRLVPATKPD